MPQLKIHSRARAALQTALGTVYLAFLISLSHRAVWSGYGAGVGDHTVLMPEGIRGAIPDAFKNDWFIDAAPQPHWFFDILIRFGVASGTIDALLLCYWLLGLAAFTLATVLFAGHVVKRHSGFSIFAVLTIAGAAPWGLFGTGTGTIGMALPTVLAGNLIYLSLVLILRRNLLAAAIVGAAVAIVHVQQGAIISVIFTVTLVTQLIFKRRIIWPLLCGLIVNVAFVVFGLRLRPVAANPGDFVEICNRIIPYHCSISQWEWTSQVAAIGGVAAAALTLLVMRKADRLRWASTVGLVLLGYLLGFIFDALRVPVLGDLAQSVNANRLGSVVIPFMFWGMVLPLLRIRAFPGFRTRAGAGWSFTGLWLAVCGLVLVDLPWGIVPFVLKYRWLVLAVLVLGALGVMFSRKWARISTGVPLVGMMLSLLLLSGLVSGVIGLRPSLNWYHAGTATEQQSWYREVGRLVPAGEVITAPGNSEELRLLSQRATIADCKNVPYGGKAWAEWKLRIYDLGIDCRSYFGYAPDMSVDTLETIAHKYASQYVVVDDDFRKEHRRMIAQHGWTPLLEPNSEVEWWLYQLPAA